MSMHHYGLAMVLGTNLRKNKYIVFYAESTS